MRRSNASLMPVKYGTPEGKRQVREITRRCKRGQMGCSTCQSKIIASYERDGWPVCHKCRKVRQANGIF